MNNCQKLKAIVVKTNAASQFQGHVQSFLFELFRCRSNLKAQTKSLTYKLNQIDRMAEASTWPTSLTFQCLKSLLEQTEYQTSESLSYHFRRGTCWVLENPL
jgi:hypothetical protein